MVYSARALQIFSVHSRVVCVVAVVTFGCRADDSDLPASASTSGETGSTGRDTADETGGNTTDGSSTGEGSTGPVDSSGPEGGDTTDGTSGSGGTNRDRFGGVYEVTGQVGSSDDERPRCFDQFQGIADVHAFTPGLAHFLVAAVGADGEPTEPTTAQYWGIAECQTATDCPEYFLLGSPSIDDNMGEFESTVFVLSEVDGYTECYRMRTRSSIATAREAGAVQVEFVNEIAVRTGTYSEEALDSDEQSCLDNPPELPEEPCARTEMLTGNRTAAGPPRPSGSVASTSRASSMP